MTGTEAISNGVPAFKAPEAPNARTTLVWMGVLLGTMFFGMNFLAASMGILPASDETVLSPARPGRVRRRQPPLRRAADRHRAHPGAGREHVLRRLPAPELHPGARSLPAAHVPVPRRPAGVHQRHRGAGRCSPIVLLVIFNGSVDQLIPLYAIGVFASFTLSQSGMVVHWRRLRRDRTGGGRPSINGLGAVDHGGRDAGDRLHQVRRGRLAGGPADSAADRVF